MLDKLKDALGLRMDRLSVAPLGMLILFFAGVFAIGEIPPRYSLYERLWADLVPLLDRAALATLQATVG